jgi:3-phosphoshikimate 1-carboxyvinyltransferase
MMQRALAAALLAEGTTVIHNPSRCDDAKAATGIIMKMGAIIEDKSRDVIIRGAGMKPPGRIHCGESGLSLRMFSPIAALNPKKVEVNGRGSLLQRPVLNILEGLEALGVDCKNPGKGLLPIELKGGYKKEIAEIDGSLGSQFLTGLLMALPCREENTVLQVKNLRSIPYVDMTLDLLKDFGIEIEHQNYRQFTIRGGQNYQARRYNIEADWSSAAPMMVAAALKGKVRMNNLKKDSLQADKDILFALEACGAKIHWEDNSLLIEHCELKAFELDATHCPDLFPPLVALAVHCDGISRIKGVHRLEHKESNRAKALIREFGKLGVEITLEGDEMVIPGGKLRGGLTHSHDDHRIAMALAIAALAAKYPVEIVDHECVAKSYPNFFRDLQKIGAGVAQFYFRGQFV